MRFKVKKLVGLLLVLCVSASLFSGCGSNGGSTADGKDFSIGIQRELVSLDPIRCCTTNAFAVVNNMYDTLLTMTADGQDVEPCIAESWELKDDKLTYVYKIRKGVKFWDGKEVTAEDVAYSIGRHMDTELASNAGYLLANVDSVEVTGDYEVTVKLKQPDETFKYAFATIVGAVVEKEFVEENGENFGNNIVGTMGTGPYKFVSWTQGSQMILEKNDNYWNSSEGGEFEKVIFNFIDDETTLATLAQSGQIDLTIQITNEVISEYENSSMMDLCYEDGLYNWYVAFNTQKEPFNDLNVRKAVATAIDSSAILNLLNGKYGSEAKGIDFDVEAMGYYTEDWNKLNEELDSYNYDLEKAKEYLSTSGYPDGFDCTIVVPNIYKKVAEVIQDELKQLNINVEIISANESEFADYQYGTKVDENGNRDYDMLFYYWLPDYADPISFLQTFYDSANITGGVNLAAYSNEEFDKLMDEQGSLEGQERSNMLMDAYRIANAECPYNFIGYYGTIYAINNKYSLKLDPLWLWTFKVTDIEKK